VVVRQRRRVHAGLEERVHGRQRRLEVEGAPGLGLAALGGHALEVDPRRVGARQQAAGVAPDVAGPVLADRPADASTQHRVPGQRQARHRRPRARPAG
jgi:hypothetical protein